LAFLSVSCEKEKSEDIIRFEPAEIPALSFQSSSFTTKVSLKNDWTLVSSQSWCKVTPESGTSGTTELTVTLDENKSSSSRTAVITVKTNSKKESITITQNKYVQPVSIADEAFKSYCLTNFDADKDGIFSVQEAATVTNVNVSGLGITSLSGIESFISLQTLNCSNNNIKELNITGITSLTNLNCSGNQLTTLDIQSNVNLKELNCTNNASLTKINVWTGFTAGQAFSKPDGASYVEPQYNTPAGYKLVWQEEFNNSRDSNGKGVLPNTTDWWYETGGNGWGNNEIENYIPAVSGADTCAQIYNGSLKITAKKVGSQVLSVRMNTSKSWTYGYFEARLKLPKGKGTWPAFWMMPKNFTAWPDDGEIDIMEEVGFRPNYVASSIHCKAYYHKIGTQKTAETYIATAESEFHVYAVEWTADYIRGYADGVKYFEFSNDHTNNKDTWPFNTPFYLKLNLAWGGFWGGAQGVDETALPATYEIDYVRVFQK
jgi:hypothetical protein